MKKHTYDLETLHQMHRAGLLDEARTGYLAVLRINPREVTAIHALGIIETQLKHYAEAIKFFQHAIELHPQDPTLYLHLANVLKTQEEFEPAAQALHKALAIQPHYAFALNNLGTVYYAQGKFNDAVKVYQQAIELQPNYIDAYYNLGLAFIKLEDYEDAAETYKKLLLLAPDHFAARFQFACIFLLDGKIKNALAEFQAIEQKFPNHLETQSNLASCYLKVGKLNEAKLHYLKALELSPDDTQILFNLGVINMHQGEVDNAIRHYQRTIQINPDFFAAHNNLGVALLAKQQLGLALQHFKAALKLQPNNASVAYTVNALSQNKELLSAPSDYIKSLFNAYADHYDMHLMHALDYQIPALLHSAVIKVKKLSEVDILDLGCGTGLCGEIFKVNAKKLIGVDIAENMLALAAQKNIYDELICENMETYLAKQSDNYDLILAGDVFVYMGDLEKIFQLAKTALRKNGVLAFNAEITADEDFKINQSGRFSHSKKYLDQLAKQNNFVIAYYDAVVTRMQNGEPVSGHLYVLVAR